MMKSVAGTRKTPESATALEPGKRREARLPRRTFNALVVILVVLGNAVPGGTAKLEFVFDGTAETDSNRATTAETDSKTDVDSSRQRGFLQVAISAQFLGRLGHLQHSFCLLCCCSYKSITLSNNPESAIW